MLTNIKAFRSEAVLLPKNPFQFFRDFYWNALLPFIGRVHLDVGSGGIGKNMFAVSENQFVKVPPENKAVVLFDPSYTFITHVPFNEGRRTRFTTINDLPRTVRSRYDSISFINSCHHINTVRTLIHQAQKDICRSVSENQYILALADHFAEMLGHVRPGGPVFVYEYSIQNTVSAQDLAGEREQQEITEFFQGDHEAFFRYHTVLKLDHFLSALRLNNITIEAYDQNDRYCWIRGRNGSARKPFFRTLKDRIFGR